MSHTKPPGTSRIARSAVAGATAVKLGARTLRHRLNQPPAPDAQARHDDEIGRLLFQAMNQLRGTALKAAQVLSLQAGFLPEGVRAQLARASHQALPLNRALVSRAFRMAFGQEPEARFAHFEPDAFAAASLGQVHRARLADGRPVAVKLQSPGIATTIDSDLSLLRGALRGGARGGRVGEGRRGAECEREAEEDGSMVHAVRLRWRGRAVLYGHPARSVQSERAACHDLYRKHQRSSVRGVCTRRRWPARAPSASSPASPPARKARKTRAPRPPATTAGPSPTAMTRPRRTRKKTPPSPTM
jgi:hypothetical protein